MNLQHRSQIVEKLLREERNRTASGGSGSRDGSGAQVAMLAGQNQFLPRRSDCALLGRKWRVVCFREVRRDAVCLLGTVRRCDYFLSAKFGVGVAAFQRG